MQVRKQQLELDMEKQTGSKQDKEYIKAVYLTYKQRTSRCLFNLYAENIMRNAGLEEAQAATKIAGRYINNLRYAEWYYPYGRKWRGTEKPLDESERGE